MTATLTATQTAPDASLDAASMEALRPERTTSPLAKAQPIPMDASLTGGQP